MFLKDIRCLIKETRECKVNYNFILIYKIFYKMFYILIWTQYFREKIFLLNLNLNEL